MAIQGSVTIQLFDATTGNLTDSVTSSNMVTNAVANILNPDLGYVKGSNLPSQTGSFLQNWYNNISPIGDILFGGIMLFNSELEEDVNNIIPSKAAREALIGYAGKGSTLAGNHLRGTYNSSESSVLANGFSHVWDFATDQANGEISAVALTSSWGGEQAWKASEYDLAKAFIPVCATASINDLTTNGMSNRGFIQGLRVVNQVFAIGYFGTFFLSDGILFKVTVANDGLSMSVVGQRFNNGIGLKDKLVNDAVSTNSGAMVWNFTSVNGFGDKYSSFCHIANGVVMVRHGYGSVANAIHFCKIEYAEGQVVVTESDITLSGINANKAGLYLEEQNAIKGNYLYFISSTKNDKMYKVNLTNGADITELTMPFTTDYGVVSAFDDTIVIMPQDMSSTDVKLAYYLNADETGFTCSTPVMCYTQGEGNTFNIIPSGVKEPFVLLSKKTNTSYSDRYSYIILAVVSAYLATINNLDNSVVKTTSKTMKITYTIQNV